MRVRCSCGDCKRCAKRIYDRQRYDERREEIIARAKDWYQENQPKKSAYDKARRNGPQREALLSEKREWYQTDKPRRRERYRNDPEFRAKAQEAVQVRRALKAKAPRVEKIDRMYLYDRDGGVCHICRRGCSVETFTLDHLVPLARGGNHTHDNLAVAHRRCNSARNADRLPAQLLLLG